MQNDIYTMVYIDTDIIIVGRGIYNNINPIESALNFSKYRKYY